MNSFQSTQAENTTTDIIHFEANDPPNDGALRTKTVGGYRQKQKPTVNVTTAPFGSQARPSKSNSPGLTSPFMKP